MHGFHEEEIKFVEFVYGESLLGNGNISIGFLEQSSHLLKIISLNKLINLKRLHELVSEDRIIFRNQGLE